MIGPNAKGLPNDTVATLAAVVLGRDLNVMGSPWPYDDDQGYFFNHTLPYGFFSRSPLERVTGRVSLASPLSGFIITPLGTSFVQALS